MNKFEVGTHRGIKGFDCLECAERFYFELSVKWSENSKWHIALFR